MKKLVSLFLIFAMNTPAYAITFGARELQADYLTGIKTSRNFIKNYGAEQNTNNVTGTNVTVARNTTAPIEGAADYSFTIDSATDVVTWSANDFDKKLSGQTCEAKLRYTADANASNVKFQVYQGASLISSVALSNSTTPKVAVISFPCGNLSSATTLKIAGSAATSTVMKVDTVQVGESEPVTVQAATKLISQNAHGFSVGQVLYYTGSTYALANANADATSEVVGVVSEIVDANSFYLTTVGFISGLSGLVAGSTYYLSASSAGALTVTAPTVGPQVNKPVLVAVSTTTGYVLQSRGYVIGPASVPTLVMSDFTNYTLTIGATITPPTPGSGVTSNAKWRRVGDSMEIIYTFTQTSGGSAGSGTYLFPLPAGYTIDSSKMALANGLQAEGVAGPGAWYSNASYPAYVVAYNSTNLAMIGSGNFFATGNGSIIGSFQISFKALVPISGWTATSSGQVAAPRSEVAVDSGNGHGSTNTKIRRFSNIRKNFGSSITYADSATLGASFTINESGIYTISYQDKYTTGPFDIGISVNDSAPTTNVYQTTYAQGRRLFTAGAAGTHAAVSWTGNLSAGDIVYAKDDGTCDVTTDGAMFTITKVSN